MRLNCATLALSFKEMSLRMAFRTAQRHHHLGRSFGPAMVKVHTTMAQVVHTLEALRALKAIGYAPKEPCALCFSSTRKMATEEVKCTPLLLKRSTLSASAMSPPWNLMPVGLCPVVF